MSYDDELDALWKWYLQKTDEYHNAFDINDIKGFDSELGARHSENTREFKRRRDAKYNIK